MDMGALMGAIGSLRAANDMAKGLVTIRDAVMLNDAAIALQQKIIDAQTTILSAQEEHSKLLARISELEGQLSEKRKWDEEAARYELRDYGGGTYAYHLRAELAAGEPDHRLCPTCFSRGTKSVLQFRFRSSKQQDIFDCRSCNTEFFLGERRKTDGGYRANDGGWMSV